MLSINVVAIVFYVGVTFMLSVLTTLAFNPFMDSDLHAIDWVGATSIDNDDQHKNVVIMKTAANEKYRCLLPESKDSDDDSARRSYTGPTPDELMDTLFQQKSCSYRIESYWTYELCHGKHIKQYHEDKELSNKKAPPQEYFLGTVKRGTKGETDPEVDKLEEEVEEKKPTEIKIKKIDNIDLPYFEVNMTDGTACDLTNKPRQARLLYVCQPDGRGEIYEFKEVSTCEYEIIVLTAVLCTNPLFKPKNAPVSKIACHALEGSPDRPTVLKLWDEEETRLISPAQTSQPDALKTATIQIKTTVEPPTIKSTTTLTKDTTLGDTTDKQVLREFLSGSHCLQGGSGWWKHELCYGKHVKQFHEDPRTGRTDVFLGYWHEQNHLEWLASHPQRRPAEIGKRKSLSYLYVAGDVCDLTGKKRLVEVRLKCVPNPQQPHSVSLYLLEPKTCEYVLGVESPLFCSVLDRADDNGFIQDKVNV